MYSGAPGVLISLALILWGLRIVPLSQGADRRSA
jgi:hypothetical protein